MANPYFIKIELPTEDKESAMAGANSASTGGNTNNASGLSAGGKKILNAAKGMVSFAAVKSTADQIISYNISTISLTTGATEYEERQSAIYSAVSQGIGAGAALIGAGIAGGPAGVVVAALGIAVSGIQKLREIEQKKNTLRLKESVENVSIGMQNVRAGTTGRRGRNQ